MIGYSWAKLATRGHCSIFLPSLLFVDNLRHLSSMSAVLSCLVYVIHAWGLIETGIKNGSYMRWYRYEDLYMKISIEEISTLVTAESVADVT